MIDFAVFPIPFTLSSAVAMLSQPPYSQIRKVRQRTYFLFLSPVCATLIDCATKPFRSFSQTISLSLPQCLHADLNFQLRFNEFITNFKVLPFTVVVIFFNYSLHILFYFLTDVDFSVTQSNCLKNDSF